MSNITLTDYSHKMTAADWEELRNRELRRVRRQDAYNALYPYMNNTGMKGLTLAQSGYLEDDGQGAGTVILTEVGYDLYNLLRI